MFLAVLMVVPAEERLAWEAYTVAQGVQEINETITVMENDPNFHGPIYYNYSFSNIYGDFGEIPYTTT